MPRYTDVVLEPVATSLPTGEPRASAPSAELAETYAMPATQGQIRFWSLDRLNPGNPALNMPLMWKFTGRLDLAALEEAFALCVARHEVLRTTFDVVNGRVTQVIHPPDAVHISVVEMRGLDAETEALEVDRTARDHAAVHFDLKTGPLLLLKLLRLDEERHLLLVSMHHIICDGISNGILLRDMAVFYERLTTGIDPGLPELPVQFGDFAVWQEEWLQGDGPGESLRFWQETLGNDFCRLQLPRDEDALQKLTERRGRWTGDIETLMVPAEMQARAHAFCRRENVTLNILLFSVFCALLHRLTGQDDLTIGSPCANRTEDTEELIGLFMNIQVMRLRLVPGETFRTLLGKVQAWTLGAYENQELPFETLVHDPYFSSGTGSFEIPIFFLYQKSFMVTHEVGGLEIVPLRSESPGAVFEMMFAIVDRAEEGPRLQLEYNPRYFKVSTVQRYLKMFVEILDSALEKAETRVDELRVMNAGAVAEMTERWNETAVDFGPFESVATAFLRRAEREPGRVALECAGVEWSYAELATYARRLAGRLIAAGLEAEDRVAICVERSPEMVGAVLAVMMAGGAYVPLDPRHPRERLEGMLAAAGVRVLLVSGELQLRTDAAVLDVREVVGEEAMPVPVGAESLAYVIYTSGSTGAPKGVAVEHGALMNLLRSMEREPGMQSDDVMVAITTLAFDIAGLELLLPLLTGAKLVLATDAEVQDGRMLLALMANSRATMLQGTPGAWRLLIDAGWAGAGEAGALPVRALCGGEALPRDLAEKMLDRTPELWNMYGPTETTIWSAATRVEHGQGALRIGNPIANTQMYVLDQRRQAVPVGVTGELYLGGAGLARGYWNAPQLTEEKFIANPFGEGRLYATGDLARRHEQGDIELLGRADFQVKVRGYRIELAEIEGTMLLHPAVKDAVVTQQRSDVTGVTRLVGYVAAHEVAPEVLIEELKAALRNSLPDYMVPTAFVVLAKLPRTANGKVDRKALPSVETRSGESGVHSTAAAADAFCAPRDVIESQLADIWQTTLGLENISVRASFFSLGVGSLAALRLITKMNRVYAMDLGLASLISASTIESIAELIRTKFAPNTASSVVPLQPRGSRPPLYIVHGVGGNVVNFYGLSMRMGGNQPVYGIQAQSLVARQAALLRLKDMATHYIADIRKVQPEGPYHLVGYSFGGTVVLEMAHQLRAAGQEVALLGMVDSKSKDYEDELARMASVQTKVQRRMTRFRGNTGALAWGERVKYVYDKVRTRAIRFTSMAAARMNFKKVPAFMRSAYDINYVAVSNYKPQPYAGRLILFRASEQDDAKAPHDLGWSSIFSEGVEVHDLPGDHERIFLEPNIDRLAESLRASVGGD